MSDVNTKAVADALSDLFAESVSIDETQQRELDGTRISIVEMEYIQKDNDRPSRVRQTAVLLEQSDMHLPDFMLRPTVKGLRGKIFGLIGTMGDINFDDSPGFSDAYFLHGWIEESVRELFVPRLRDFFANDSRWSVRGQGSQVVIYQNKKQINAQQHDAFVQDALEILALLQQGQEALDARPELRRDTTPADMSATAQRMDGIVGSMLQRQLNELKITHSQLDEFVSSPIPRSVPSGLSKQVVGQWGIAIVVGIVMAVIGAVFAAITWTLGEGNERFIAFGLALTPIFGIGVAIFGVKYRGKKYRMLREGTVQEGVITDITRTDTKIDDQQQYLVQVAYGDPRQPMTAPCKVLGTAHERAKSMMNSQSPVRVLIDPQDSTNVVCVDLLLIFDD